jgi:CRP-like cAMP-binding protein
VGVEMQTNHSVVRVTGTVADLKMSTTSENFVSGSGDRVVGTAAAVGLGAAGLAGAATGAAMSSGDSADKVTAFTCTVGGQKVVGRFGEVTFANGEQIEVVGTVFSGELSALAVVRTSDRSIWMHPHCSRGTKAYRRFCLRWIPALSVLTPTVFVSLMTLISGGRGFGFLFFAVMISAGAIAVATLLLLFARKFRHFAKLSDQIFAVLEFDQPEAVDLPRRLAQASNALSREERKRYHPWSRWVYKY